MAEIETELLQLADRQEALANALSVRRSTVQSKQWSARRVQLRKLGANRGLGIRLIFTTETLSRHLPAHISVPSGDFSSSPDDPDNDRGLERIHP